MLTRRTVIASTLATLLERPARAFLQTPAVTSASEEQKGDPDLPYETVTFNPDAISRMSSDSIGGRAIFETWQATLPAKMLATARGLIGSSRKKTPEKVAEFLELFDLKTKDAAQKDVPFCAAGLSYCVLMAYADMVKPNYAVAKRMEVLRSLAPDTEHYYFYPTVSCNDMSLIAQGKRRWIDRKTQPTIVPKPGWIALFDWGGRGKPDHCGIVQSVADAKLFTVEFNTSPNDAQGSERDGGAVEQKTRNYAAVVGFIVTDIKPARI